MEEALEMARAKDTKEGMAAVERLDQLLDALVLSCVADAKSELINEEDGGIHRRHSHPSFSQTSAPSNLPGYGTSAIVAMDRSSNLSSGGSLSSGLLLSHSTVSAIESMLGGLHVSDRKNPAALRSSSLDLGVDPPSSRDPPFHATVSASHSSTTAESTPGINRGSNRSSSLGDADITENPIEPINAYSLKELMESEKNASTLVPEKDCSMRISTMQRVEGLVAGGATDYSCFRGLLKQLVRPLSTQLADRRSTIVKQVSSLFSFRNEKANKEKTSVSLHCSTSQLGMPSDAPQQQRRFPCEGEDLVDKSPPIRSIARVFSWEDGSYTIPETALTGLTLGLDMVEHVWTDQDSNSFGESMVNVDSYTVPETTSTPADQDSNSFGESMVNVDSYTVPETTSTPADQDSNSFGETLALTDILGLDWTFAIEIDEIATDIEVILFHELVEETVFDFSI